MRMPPKVLWFLLLAPTLTGFDFWTKRQIVEHIPVGGEVPLLPGHLAFVHQENPVAAFSMPIPSLLLLVAALVAMGVILHTLYKLPASSRLPAIALGLLAAGALGNLVDRLADGTVTDFVCIYTVDPRFAPWLVSWFGTSTWPIFNVADAAIVAGGFAWLVHWILEARKPQPEPTG